MRNKTNLKTFSHHPSSVFPGPTSLPAILRPTAEQQRGMRNGGCIFNQPLHHHLVVFVAAITVYSLLSVFCYT